MAQLITFVVSLFITLSVWHGLDNSRTSHHIKIHMPPTSTAAPAGVSGGGPVGIGPIVIPTPQPGNSGR